MLKKLASALALTSLAFGSGLCFDPYNHDYGVSTEQLVDLHNLEFYNKTIILHNGKMLVDKGTNARIRLVRYVVNGNKALILIKGKGDDFESEYFVLYTECINGKPVTKDVEEVSDFSPAADTVDLPKYPIKLGFYKDGFWVKALTITWIKDNKYSCDYLTDYFSYKLITDKNYKVKFKDQYLPPRVCTVLAHKIGM
jgi:hypothetical protein